MRRPGIIEIVGGGLAGLSLGLALRRQDVPVRLLEAGRYPRAKVCGEFIAGLDAGTVRVLGLEPWLAGRPRHRIASWHGRHGRLFRHRLPQPAIGVSRHTLDTQLAHALVVAGGDLRENSRVTPGAGSVPGRVWTHGRRLQRGGWTALKLHARGLTLDGDLEMHLGDGAYVGLAAVEDGWINVCGLFAPRRAPGDAAGALDRHLRHAGLTGLADRLAATTIRPDSRAAVAGVQFGRRRAAGSDPLALALGDAFAAIPPFTGHGMAMALQGAATALDPLTAWSRGECDWSVVCRRVRHRLQRRFALRLAASRLLHPWLTVPRAQALMARLHARRALPLRLLYHALH